MGEVVEINPEVDNSKLSADECAIVLNAVANTGFPGSASEVISRIKFKLGKQIANFDKQEDPSDGNEA